MEKSIRNINILLFIGYNLIIIVILFFGLELVYRFQLIDTYRAELHSYNIKDDLLDHKDRKTILIMGDSYTVGNDSYTKLLQERLKNYRIINSGISGTGIIQASIIAPKRFREFNPRIFIYQVYVGSDLFDIRYSLNWENIGLIRNLYWFVSNHLRFISFLNYRVAQIIEEEQATNGVNGGIQKLETISVTNNNSRDSGLDYTDRVKIYLSAEPYLVDDSIMVKNNRIQDFQIFLNKLEELIDLSRHARCKAVILIIPHCCQLNDIYLNKFKYIGAKFTDPARVQDNEYPFIAALRKKYSGESNVTVLNPLERLRQAENIKHVYYQNDDHLTPFGQSIIADFVIEQLQL